MALEKRDFLKKVVVLVDSREQENRHILARLDALGVPWERRKLDFGDYSFTLDGRDFSLLCVAERKANVDELYGNLTQDRGRIEREFEAGSRIANQFLLVVEGCADMDSLRRYQVPDWQMEALGRKVQEIGALCYATLKSWQCGDRYRFRTLFAPDPNETATLLLEEFYYWWRNFKLLTASRRNRG